MDFLKKIFCILLITSLIQGCVNAAVSGAQVVYNRHNLGNSFTDNRITMQASNEVLAKTHCESDKNVSISTFHNVVLLTGQVPSLELKKEIGSIVNNISDVKEVYNMISIGPVTSSLTRISDSWITTKIKSEFIATNEIDPNEIKIVTENGTVYLMGILMPEQAEIAVDIARTTAGVQNVVKVFSYIKIIKKLA